MVTCSEAVIDTRRLPEATVTGGAREERYPVQQIRNEGGLVHNVHEAFQSNQPNTVDAVHEHSQIPLGACLHYSTQAVPLHYRLRLFVLPEAVSLFPPDIPPTRAGSNAGLLEAGSS